MSPVEVKEITPDLLNRIGRLRVLAWQERQPAFRNMDVWLDHIDETARHWIVEVDGEIVASARASIHNGRHDLPDAELYRDVSDEQLHTPIASLNRLVVHPKFEGQGLSLKLDRARLKAVQSCGCRTILVVAVNDRRARQLTRLNFQTLKAVIDNDPLFSKPVVHLMAYLHEPSS